MQSPVLDSAEDTKSKLGAYSLAGDTSIQITRIK